MLYPAKPDFHVVALLDYNRMLDIQHLMPDIFPRFPFYKLGYHELHPPLCFLCIPVGMPR